MSLKKSINYQLSSGHQFVLLGTNVIDAPILKAIPHVKMSFIINYYGAAVNPPTLTFLINPTNISYNLSKKISAPFSRNGPVTETWGDMQDSISCSGKIGGYYVSPKDSQAGDPTPGLNRYDRSNSASFQNLLQLIMLYRNNGAIFQNNKPIVQYIVNANTTVAPQNSGPQPSKLISSMANVQVEQTPSIVSSSKNRIDRLGDLTMLYDGTLYTGSFDTLTVEEDSLAPYNLNYSFTFTVQKTRPGQTGHPPRETMYTTVQGPPPAPAIKIASGNSPEFGTTKTTT